MCIRDRYPRAAHTVHFKGAPIDEAPLARIWREEVDADTVFRASSWREALEMCNRGEAA